MEMIDLCKLQSLLDNVSCIPLSTKVALLGVIVSSLSIYINIRYQLIASINSKLAELARECYRDIELDKGDSNDETHAIKETTQHISHTVSTIISARQLLERQINRNKFFILWIAKRTCIDKLFIQLHTSTKAFIMDKERHKNFVDNSIKNNYDMDQIYHIMEQIKYCNKWFKKSYKTYGNATPIELQKKIKDFKAIENRNEKISALNKLTDSE